MGRSVHRVYHKSCDQSPSTRRDEEPLTAVRTNSESFTRTFRRQKRKDHPSASPEPPVRAPKTKERSHSVRQTRSRDQTSSKDFTVRRGIDYGDIDSGEECINVAVPQDALSLIKAERGGKKRVTNLSTTISSIMSTIYTYSFPQHLQTTPLPFTYRIVCKFKSSQLLPRSSTCHHVSARVQGRMRPV
jgi:hypothetical protein